MAEDKKIDGRKVDEDTDAMIYHGVTLSQICTIFSMDSRDVKEKIVGRVMPVGKRGANPIYQIKEVAPFLVAPPYDMDEFIQRMSIADLPTVLRKEYWAGMRSRQLYEVAAAELWPTSQVVDTLAELFKTLRLSLLISRESVERETELTPRQRDIITHLIDKAMEEAHAATTRRFSQTKTETARIETERNVEIDDPEEL